MCSDSGVRMLCLERASRVGMLRAHLPGITLTTLPDQLYYHRHLALKAQQRDKHLWLQPSAASVKI